eukprot:SAG11_NODE_879_length_6759_cov_5.103904_4_plen_157_part_00
MEMSICSATGAGTLFVGGEAGAVQRATPYFSAVASTLGTIQAVSSDSLGISPLEKPAVVETVHCGAAGTGNAAVLSSGILRHVTIAAMAEAARYGQDFGVKKVQNPNPAVHSFPMFVSALSPFHGTRRIELGWSPCRKYLAAYLNRSCSSLAARHC